MLFQRAFRIVLLSVILVALAAPAFALNFQMHYNAPWWYRWIYGETLGTWYRFTEDGQWLTPIVPVGLPYCEWVNVPYPVDANDARVGGWFVDEQNCDNVDRAEAGIGGMGEVTLIAGATAESFDAVFPDGGSIIAFPSFAVDVFDFLNGAPPGGVGPEDLDGYLNPSILALSGGDYTYLGDPLYIGINFEEWLASGDENPAAGTTFNIVNGLHEDLDGYVFSTLPLSYDPVLGWLVDNGSGPTPFEHELFGFSGEVVTFAELGSCVPEPATLCLFGIGMAGMALRRFGKHRHSR